MHHFTALFFICFGLKAIYFFASSKPFFVLSPLLFGAEINRFIILESVMLSSLFIAIVIFTYRSLRPWLAEREWTLPAKMPPEIVGAALLLIAVYFWYQRGLATSLFSGDILSLFIRVQSEQAAIVSDASAYVVIKNVVRFFALVLFIDAVLRKNHLVVAIVSIFFLLEILLSAGSRFTLLSSALVFPLVILVTKGRRLMHGRAITIAVYVATLCLPLLAALLLILRAGGGGTFNVDNTVGSALSSFDSLDHFLFYLGNHTPSLLNWRYADDFLQLIPRSIFPDKQQIYGMLALQVELYPDSIGGGVAGSLSYGHFPLSIMTMSYDFLGIVGVIGFGTMTGLLLAGLDYCSHSRSPLLLAVFIFHLVYMFNFIRQGVLNFALAQVQVVYLPFALLLALLWIGSGRAKLAAYRV